jgi:uncharacterized protein YraI
MTISRFAGRAAASAAALSLCITPAMAKPVDGMQDLVGARGGQAEHIFGERGWTYVTGGKSDTEAYTYWWHEERKDCMKVTTFDGRYTALEEAKDKDCGKSGSNAGTVAAVAAVGALALGALLLSKKDKNKNDNDGNYQGSQWQQVEAVNLQTGSLRIFDEPDKNSRVRGSVREGALLRNYGCDDYNSEVWCEVTTSNGRTRGWARDRYLRVTQGGSYPGNGGGNWGGGYRDQVEVYGLSSGTLRLYSGPSKSDRMVGSARQGDVLTSLGCRSSEGEDWCEVESYDRRTRGWARERYLRSTGSNGGYNPGYGNNRPGYGGGTETMVQVYGLSSGTLSIFAGPSKSDRLIGSARSGDRLRRLRCENAGGESWCEVVTLDGYTRGWARERYLRGAY